MLFTSFSSPRRLALLAVVLFTVTLVFLQSTSYSKYLPKYDIPGFSTTKNGEQESSLEEDQPGRLEKPSDEGLKVPGAKQSTSSVQATTSSQADYGWRIDATATSTSTEIPTHSLYPSQTAASNASAGGGSLLQVSYESIQLRVQELIKAWTPPPVVGHWPPYDGYFDKDYDPNRWEGFEWDRDFYLNNGIKKLREDTPVKPLPYLPYPEYNSPAWKKQWHGQYEACEGARGKLLNDSAEDIVMAYRALPETFPQVAVGDANATGIDLDYCFDRYNRFGPYGHGQGERSYVDNWKRPFEKPDWSAVHWGQLQDQCLMANKDRYAPTARQPVVLAPGKALPKGESTVKFANEQTSAGQPKHHSRTALLIRTWEGYKYTENDLEAIRALITELSLLSGGEYQVFLFVNVKDNNADIFNNQQVYDDVLKQNVPRELQSIAILWNEKICQEWYPQIGDWQVYWHQFMPLQWFSITHPEFDFVWNWETDARYTGNHYAFLEAVSNFSRALPRKYMWERNQRFYFPGAHGSYEQWLNDTDRTIERGMHENVVDPVWGPKPYNPNLQKPIGPTPPHPMKDDDFQWGVGEEADLITLQPIWDPTHTDWSYRDKIWNFIPGVRPHFSAEDPLDNEFHNPEFANIPKRTYINTVSRFSKRQLEAMHLENLAGRTTQAEMFPTTVALHHGLKAVYAPHPIWTDRKWPAWYMDAVFNADDGKPAQWGQQRDSVYNHDREHNFAGWSWYYQSEFPKSLYRRWLGWATEDASPWGTVRGQAFEEGGVFIDFGHSDEPGGVQVFPQGRMCLPPMLLHPVKKVSEETVEYEAWESY